MKRIFFVGLILFLASCLSEDGIELGKPSTFIKFYHDGYENIPVDIRELEDGGFIMLMNSTIKNSDADNPKEKIVLAKIDQYGNEVWRQYHPPATPNPTETRRWKANSLTILDDGGYLIAGEAIQGLNSSLLIMRANPDGSLAQNKVVALTSVPEGISVVGKAAVTRTDNGNYLFLANATLPAADQMVFGELNKSDLSVVWDLSRGDDESANLIPELFYNVNGSGNLHWGGTVIQRFGDDSDIRLTENPINSIPASDVTYGTPDASEVANDMCLSGASVFAFAGSVDVSAQGNNKDIYFYKAGEQDGVRFTYQFVEGGTPSFPNDKNEEANSIANTKDSGYIILATFETYTGVIGRGNTDVLLMKINGFGDHQWSVPYGTINADNGKAVRQTSDGGYVVLASSDLAGSVSTVMLIKTDKNGNVD